MTVLALMGMKALWFLVAWLAGCIAASYLSGRKGYGEMPGLRTGLFLSLVAPLVWLFVPAKPNSEWKTFGPFGSTRKT